VKVVDVLRDAAVQAVEAVKLGERQVRRVRPGGPDDGIGDPAELPVLPSAADAAHEVLVGELARVDPIQRPRTAKVGNAGLGASLRLR